MKRGDGFSPLTVHVQHRCRMLRRKRIEVASQGIEQILDLDERRATLNVREEVMLDSEGTEHRELEQRATHSRFRQFCSDSR
jgi:hypothetical protein